MNKKAIYYDKATKLTRADYFKISCSFQTTIFYSLKNLVPLSVS